MDKLHESAVLSYSTESAIDARKKIFAKMNSYDASEEEKERSLGLFLKSSLLARILAITDIYKQILNIPGAILDIGTWRGQTAVICENLRAIFEPLHFNRKIICFDTFEGYCGFSEKDKPTFTHKNFTYTLGGVNYADFLNELLILHEKSNAMGEKNHGKHKVISGDCVKTIPEFFKDYGNLCIALAFFDLNSYEPTRLTIKQVWQRLVPNGIIAFWQLSRDVVPAEGMVYVNEILSQYPHTVHYCSTYPGLCFLIKQPS